MGGSGTAAGGTVSGGSGGDVSQGGSAGSVTSGGSSANGGSAAQGGSSAGSGGSAGKGGVDGGAGAPAIKLELIDDLEDGDKQITVVNNPLRNGIWDTGHDTTSGATQTPTPGAFKPIDLGSDVPYAGDLFAAYTKGQGFMAYGAFMNVSMTLAADPKYDATRYSGISFWAKVGTGSTKAMRVRFISGDTDPRGKICKDPAVTPSATQPEYCFNHYYSSMALSTSWKQYRLDFTNDFHQGTDGMTFASINLKTMYGLEFYFNVDEVFEVWIDDLSFVVK